MLKSKGVNHQDRWFTPFFRLQYVSLLTAYVSKAADCQRMVEKTVEKWGHLDYAVNDAGISGRFAPFDQLKIEEFDKVMNVDFRGTMLSLHAEIQ